MSHIMRGGNRRAITGLVLLIRLTVTYGLEPVAAHTRWDDLPTDGSAPFWATVPPASGNKCAKPGAIPIILDWDANIDDVVALSYLAKEPMYEIKAVILTATGFSNSGPGSGNTFRLLELLGLGHVDVGVGPLHDAYEWKEVDVFRAPTAAYSRLIPRAVLSTVDAWYGVIHNHLPYSPRHAYTISLSEQLEFSSSVYKRHVDAGVTTVLTLGTMTSLHKFQVDHPSSFAKLTHLYSMFGAVDVPGNVFTWPQSKAEFNAIGDPHAARAVLSSPEIEHITLIPLDATNDAPMTSQYLATLAGLRSPEGSLVSELTHRVRNTWHSGYNGFFGQDQHGNITPQALRTAYFFWDSLAVSVMCNPSQVGVMRTERLEVVASDPPNLDTDGWLRRSESGRLITYVSRVTREQVRFVEEQMANMLDRKCIEDQPLPLGKLIERMAADSFCTSSCAADPNLENRSVQEIQ